jgi:hypothetical protein
MKTKTLLVIVALVSMFAIGCKSNGERNWDKAKDATKDTDESVKDAANSTAEAAKDVAGEAHDKMHDK